MAKNKKKNKKKKFNLIDWLDKYILDSKNLLYMLVLYLAYIFISTPIHNHQLRKYGIESQAFVYAIHNPVKGGTGYKYRFTVRDFGQYYQGITVEKHEIGDSITIVYLPDKPKTNRNKNTLYQSQNK